MGVDELQALARDWPKGSVDADRGSGRTQLRIPAWVWLDADPGPVPLTLEVERVRHIEPVEGTKVQKIASALGLEDTVNPNILESAGKIGVLFVLGAPKHSSMTLGERRMTLSTLEFRTQ